MKYICSFIATFLIYSTSALSQEHFFILSEETWRTTKIIEYDTYYLSLGLGATMPSSNHIQFSKLSKSGEHLDEWMFKLDSTHTTEFVYQQAVTDDEYGNRIIVGAISYPPEISKPIATYLRFNYDFTEYLNDNWIYQPFNLDVPALFSVSMPINNERMIYAANYSHNQRTHSIILQGDTNGNLDWESSYECGNGCNMEVRNFIPTNDGGYLFTNHEKRNFWQTSKHIISTIIKVDSLGEQQWRIYPGSIGDPYTSEEILVVPTDDGNYLCAWTDRRVLNINTYQTNPNGTIWFAKIDEAGNKLWEKNIQDEIDAWDVDDDRYKLSQMIRLSDDNIILIGYGSFGNIIIKITQNANVLWARDIFPTELESPNSSEAYVSLYGITETSDGGFACTGEANIFPGTAFPEFQQTGFVLKLDEYGCLEEGCHLDDPLVSVEEATEKAAKFTLYPNPTNQAITIDYILPSTTHTRGQCTHRLG